METIEKSKGQNKSPQMIRPHMMAKKKDKKVSGHLVGQLENSLKKHIGK